MKEKVIQSFNRIALLEDKWDHNRNYFKLLMKEIGFDIGRALDIGCGTGEFTEKLAKRAKLVTGIDIAPVMIEEAQKRHPAGNIQYVLKDFDCADEGVQYDYIVSVATFHHLTLETALPKIQKMLKPGGTLAVLDLYERKGILDRLMDIIAVPASFFVKSLKNGPGSDSREETEAWNEHCKLDKYMTIKDLKNTYEKNLGGCVKIRRLLYWRYIAVYRKG